MKTFSWMIVALFLSSGCFADYLELPILPVHGGTGVNTSASTGCALVSAGTWSIPSLSSCFASFYQTTATTTGDLIYGGASGTPTRLAIGSSGQTLTVVAGAPAWASTPTGPSDSHVIVIGSNGYGTTNGAQRRFNNVQSSAGSDITYTSSASLGDTFTINNAGVYDMVYWDLPSTPTQMQPYIARNKTVFGYNTNGLIGAVSNCDGAAQTAACYTHVSYYLNAGDVISAAEANSASGITSSTTTSIGFAVTKVGFGGTNVSSAGTSQYLVDSGYIVNNGTTCTVSSQTSGVWTASRGGTGLCTITFNESFTATPFCTFGGSNLGSNDIGEGITQSISSTSITEQTYTHLGTTADGNFVLTCQGPH